MTRIEAVGCGFGIVSEARLEQRCYAQAVARSFALAGSGADRPGERESKPE
jgi:hypothetical protein